MRFLLDENLSTRLVDLLAVAGHDVVHVRAMGLVSAPDPVILARAVDERRVLVTLDTDFGELSVPGRRHRASSCSAAT